MQKSVNNSYLVFFFMLIYGSSIKRLGVDNMLKTLKLGMCVSLLCSMLMPLREVYASSEETIDEEQIVIEKVEEDFEQLERKLEALDGYKISFRFMNIDENQLLADGEIIGNSQNGDARLTYDIYEYNQDEDPVKLTYDLISYREFGLAYINTINLLEDSGFFEQDYFAKEIGSQFAAFSEYYVPISGSELASISLNDSLYSNLLYLPNLELINQINAENIYQLNDSTIIDMERLEIPRGLFQDAGSLSLDYYLNIDINDSNHRLVDYDVVTTQRFNVSENSTGISFKTNLESRITDSLLAGRLNDQEDPLTDYDWLSDISTNHVTDKLTKATIHINPEMTSYSVTLTGLYEQFLLNIFSSQTADIQSFNYRLELMVTPTQEVIPSLDELQTMTMTEFSYLLESSLTKEENIDSQNLERLN